MGDLIDKAHVLRSSFCRLPVPLVGFEAFAVGAFGLPLLRAGGYILVAVAFSLSHAFLVQDYVLDHPLGAFDAVSTRGALEERVSASFKGCVLRRACASRRGCGDDGLAEKCRAGGIKRGQQHSSGCASGHDDQGYRGERGLVSY